MPISNKFRFTAKTRKDIGKYAGQFNAKITRLIKKSPELKSYLPERINAESVRQEIREGKITYTEAIDRMKRFIKKGSETMVAHGEIKETRFKMGEIRRGVKKINEERKAILEKYEPSTEKGTMGTIRANSLVPKTIPKNPTKQSWRKFKESLEKQLSPSYYEDRTKRYVDNYLKAFDEYLSVNKPAEWDEYQSLLNKTSLTLDEEIRIAELKYNVKDYEDYLQLKSRLENLSPDEFEKLYYNEPDLGIDYVYSPEGAVEIRSTITRALDRYERE